MLLHIRPRMYCPFTRAVQLVDMMLDPLGLELRDGIDLITRRPYANKHYTVACRRHGHNKAFDGILIETERPAGELISTARWAIDAELVVTHRVHYRLLDDEFDAASDDMILWNAWAHDAGEWSNRRPAWAKGLAPATAEPRMEILPSTSDAARERDNKLRRFDTIDEHGRIVERHEVFGMPTIERERLTDTKFADTLETRLPPIDTAFSCAGHKGDITRASFAASRPEDRSGSYSAGPRRRPGPRP